MEAVRCRGMKVAQAAKRFDIPFSTLHDHIKGKVSKVGAGSPTILTEREEQEIVASVQVLQEIGFGVTKDLVGVVIRDYLKDQEFRPNPFRDGVPGKDWWHRFMSRWHSQISVRKPQHLPVQRALSATPEVMDAWFHRIDELYEKTGLKSLPPDELQHYIWNCDETGFCTSAAVSKILAKRGDKDVQLTMGGSGRDYITVLGAGCADGTRLPPYIVYKGKNLWHRWIEGGPSGSVFSVSDSGWMEHANFMQWFEKLFLPAVKHLTSKFPVILFFDGHHSHMSLELIEMARTNNIHLVCFPPHCTHILQPLDVSVFGPLKTSWKSVLKMHQLETCAAVVTKEDFPMLLKRLLDKSFLPQHLISGFIKCGLCPLSREKIPPHKLRKADPYVKLPDSKSSEEETASGTDKPSQSDVGMNSESNCLPKQSVVLELSGECTINKTITPVRLHLRGYFTEVLQKNRQQRTRQMDKRKVRPKFYGEALTLDEVHERLLMEEEEKKAAKQKKQEERELAKQKRKAKQKKQATKGKKKTVAASKARARKQSPRPTPSCSSSDVDSEEDNGLCEECGAAYKDDDMKMRKCWLGCDSCDKWFHYQCVGLRSIPKGYWSCKYCV